MPLVLQSNISRPDEFYARLIAAHEGLNEDESAALNARLVLVLANQIGDGDILDEAIAFAARKPRDAPAPR